MSWLLIVLIAVAIVLVVWVVGGFRIVRPYQRGIVERFGRYRATVDPGLRLVIPFVDKIRIVDLREQVVDVPPQEVITKDNVVVSVDAIVFFEPTDPKRVVYNIMNFTLAVTKLAQTNLRNLVGDMQLDEALTSRDTINTHLREILDDATDKWGVKVVRVEIQRIDPPPDVMHSMHEQMKAERQRRALVTTATGDREAAITRAEGERQAVILQAEANKQQQVLQAAGLAEATRNLADAERYKREAEAAGQAAAIKLVYGAIHAGNPTPDLLAVKYLEALGQIADGRATKIFLPADTSSVMSSLAGVAELFKDGANGSGNGNGVPAGMPGGAPGTASTAGSAAGTRSSAATTVESELPPPPTR